MQLLFHLQNQCFLLLLYQIYCIGKILVQFYPKTKVTSLFFLIFLCFIIVTFIILSYIEMIQYKSLFFTEKGKLNTHTVLLASRRCFFSWSRTMRPKPMSPHSGKVAALPLRTLLGVPQTDKGTKCFFNPIIYKILGCAKLYSIVISVVSYTLYTSPIRMIKLEFRDRRTGLRS